MEITLKNAFYVTIRISIKPCLAAYTIVAEIFQEKTYKIACYLLQKPILTVFIAIAATIFLMIALTVSFIIISGITCLAILFTLVESIFLLICVLILANITTIIMLTLMITYLIKIKSYN